MTKTPTPASHAVNTAPVGFMAQASIDCLREDLDVAKVFATKEGLLDYFTEAVPVALYAQPSRECLQQSAQADELDAWKCEKCDGTGTHRFDAWGDSPRGQYPITQSEDCDECNATGWCGPDASRAAALQAAPPAPAAVAVPSKALPYEPTSDMLIAARACDPALPIETVRAIYWAMWRAALATAPAQAVPTDERQRMTAGRASFFMERFLKEEKLLGPNEQAALHFVIDMLEAPEQAVAVTDDMALAFHRAISDGAIGQDDVDEIKAGLRAVLCNAAAPAQEHATQLAGQGQDKP